MQPRLSTLALLALAALLARRPAGAAEPDHPRPLMRDFMGLNVHTVQFKPGLFAPVCRELRDYHPLGWDFGGDTTRAMTFPLAANRVDWQELYGTWSKDGFVVDACLMFDDIAPDKWADPGRDARAYGESFAKYFGPSGGRGIVSSVEIGNEPAKYSEAQYRTIFDGMAHGLRAGDPKLKIVTCAMMTGKPDPWSKPMSAIDGLESLYDVLNIHSYPFKDKWPTWRRSFPEDPSIPYLKVIDDLARWRDEHARDKEIWLTEFGYDSATKPPDPKSEWKQWVGVSDEQQAQYIVRSFLTLSAMDVDRAYLYFFNDKDEPQLHGASGITRNFKPKAAFHAMSHLYRSVGDYRFRRAVVRKDGDLYCFEFDNPAKPAERVFVAWSPTGQGKSATKVLPIGAAAAGGVYRAELMPIDAAPARQPGWKKVDGGIELEVGASPVYLWSH